MKIRTGCTVVLAVVCFIWNAEAAAQEEAGLKRLTGDRAGDCGCTVAQVRDNTVVPCGLVIGEIVTVQTAGEFRAAIDRANTEGGNLTILIADGSYRIASTASFPYLTASNVVIRGLSGRRDAVILEGDGMRDVEPATEDGLLIAGDHVTIADLTIRGVGNHGIQVSGHHLFVHNVRIQDTYQQMLKGATDRASIDSGIVQCSRFEYTDGIGPNYYIGGLDIHKGRGWIVRDNHFQDIQSPAGSVAEHAVHFWNDCADNTVERNVILNCDRGIGFGLGGSENRGGIIRNNFIYNRGAGIFPDVGIALETSPGTKVYNNTIVVSYANAIEYRFAGTHDVEIVNNLSNRAIRARDGGTATLATNNTDAEESWFIDATAGNLHLVSALPGVVDGGSDAAVLVADDIDRTPRPQGNATDIGADEYSPPVPVAALAVPDDIAVFPNPGSGVFTIRTAAEHAALEVRDMLGRTVHSATLHAGTNTVDLRALPEGAYLFVVHSGRTPPESALVLLR